MHFTSTQTHGAGLSKGVASCTRLFASLLVPLLAVALSETTGGWCIVRTLFWKSLSCTSFVFLLVTHSTVVASPPPLPHPPPPPRSPPALFFFPAWRFSAPSAYFVIKIHPSSIICTQLLPAAALTSAPWAGCRFTPPPPNLLVSTSLWYLIYHWVSWEGRVHGVQLCCRWTAGGGIEEIAYTGGHCV